MECRDTKQIKTIIVHCSASDNPRHDNVQTIRQWHKERGFEDIGYHFVITKDGTSFPTRHVGFVGAHAEGFNKQSIGICLTGDKEFSDDQFSALRFLIKHLMMMYHIEIKDVLGHCQVNPHKTCPNFNVEDLLINLKGDLK